MRQASLPPGAGISCEVSFCASQMNFLAVMRFCGTLGMVQVGSGKDNSVLDELFDARQNMHSSLQMIFPLFYDEPPKLIDGLINVKTS